MVSGPFPVLCTREGTYFSRRPLPITLGRKQRADYLGFGQMGLFDAELVVQSVENDAVPDVEPPTSASPHQAAHYNRVPLRG